MTTTAYAPASRAASPAALLAGLRADRAAADAAEARILAGAVAWAEAHPAQSTVDAAAHWEHGVGVPLAGEGTPLVAEWCVAELAAALGSTTSSSCSKQPPPDRRGRPGHAALGPRSHGPVPPRFVRQPPLCRRHHRLKTHAGWTYTMLEPGTYLWRSPAGLAYQRDHTGTAPLE